MLFIFTECIRKDLSTCEWIYERGLAGHLQLRLTSFTTIKDRYVHSKKDFAQPNANDNSTT